MNDGKGFLAFSDDNVQGIVTMDTVGNGIYVPFLYVHNFSRRQGIGRELMENVAYRARNASRIELHLPGHEDYYQGARGFYERLGFELIDHKSGKVILDPPVLIPKYL